MNLSEIRNNLAAYNQACLQFKPEPKEGNFTDAEGQLVEQKTITTIEDLDRKFRIPSKADFLAALRADGSVGTAVASHLENLSDKSLDEREIIVKGMAEYDRMSGIFGRKTSKVTKNDIINAFTPALVNRFKGTLGGAYDKVMTSATHVETAQKTLNDTLNSTDSPAYNAMVDNAITTLANMNADLAADLNEFICICAHLPEPDRQVMSAGLAKFDELFERADVYAHALDEMAADLRELNEQFINAQKINNARAKKFLTLPNKAISNMLTTLNDGKTVEANKIETFLTKMDTFEAKETLIANQLDEKKDEPEYLTNLLQSIGDLQTTTSELNALIPQTWEFETQEFTVNENHQEVKYQSTSNPRAVGVVSDLCARLEKLEKNLATFSIFAQKPLEQPPKLMVTAALLFIKPKKKPMNAEDFKAALTIISTSKEEDCNAVATLYEKMSQGLYPTPKEREAAKVAIDNLLALQAVQNKDNAKQMLENLKNVKMFISSLPEKDDAQLVRDAYTGKIDLENMINLKIQGAKDRMILREDALVTRTNGCLKNSKEVGKGQFNVVTMMDFVDPVTGEQTTFVMKPIENADQGFTKSTAAKKMYPKEIGQKPHVVANNFCAWKGADALGCGHVIARSGMAFVRRAKKAGYELAMEKAPGTTLANASNQTNPSVQIVDITQMPEAQKQSDPGISFKQALDRLSKEERQKAEDELMFRCNDLEWADFLSGQTDRHLNNVMLGANLYFTTVEKDGTRTETWSLKDMTLKGIDNDLSFPMVNITPLGNTATSNDMMNAHTSGFNSLRLPSFVTQTMLEKLNCYDKEHDQFLKDVGADDLLTEKQKETLLKRLDLMVKHAHELENNNLCVPDFNKDYPLEPESRDAIVNKMAKDRERLMSEAEKTINELTDEKVQDMIVSDIALKKKQNKEMVRKQYENNKPQFKKEQLTKKRESLKLWCVKVFSPLFDEVMRGMSQDDPARKLDVSMQSSNSLHP